MKTSITLAVAILCASRVLAQSLLTWSSVNVNDLNPERDATQMVAGAYRIMATLTDGVAPLPLAGITNADLVVTERTQGFIEHRVPAILEDNGVIRWHRSTLLRAGVYDLFAIARASDGTQQPIFHSYLAVTSAPTLSVSGGTTIITQQLAFAVGGSTTLVEVTFAPTQNFTNMVVLQIGGVTSTVYVGDTYVYNTNIIEMINNIGAVFITNVLAGPLTSTDGTVRVSGNWLTGMDLSADGSSLSVVDGTNAFGVVRHINLGFGLEGVMSGTALTINVAGPPPEGASLTNVIALQYDGAVTQVWTAAYSGWRKFELWAGGGTYGSSTNGDAGYSYFYEYALIGQQYAFVVPEGGYTAAATSLSQTVSAFLGGGKGFAPTNVASQRIGGSGGCAVAWKVVSTGYVLRAVAGAGSGGTAQGGLGQQGGGRYGMDGSFGTSGNAAGRGATDSAHAQDWYTVYGGMMPGGTAPGFLQGGDGVAQVNGNATRGCAGGGAPGYLSGSGGLVANSNGGGGSGGSAAGWVNPEVIGDTIATCPTDKRGYILGCGKAGLGANRGGNGLVLISGEFYE